MRRSESTMSQSSLRKSMGAPRRSNVHGRGDASIDIHENMSSSSSPAASRSGSTYSLLTPQFHRSAGDKTVCEYCGVSYLTMSEMRALQTKVKDQEEKLNQLRETILENNRMKETLGTIRKNHRKEISKRDEECQRWVVRCNSVENEVERLKRELQESQGRNADLAQKYAIASEDFKQQEDVICQLRSKLQVLGDMEAENNGLRNKNKNLEDNLQKLLQEIKSLRSAPPASNTSSKLSDAVGSNETATLRAKVSELTDRCNRLTSENVIFQEEIAGLRRGQDRRVLSPGGDSPKVTQKLPSVVSVEVHDLKRENAILQNRLQSVTDEHSNCQDMHAFLRESIEKLKSDSVRLVDEMNSVKVKYEESLLKIENFQAVISGYQAERNRFMASYKEQQNKLEQLAAQNRAFHKSSDPKLIESLKSTINGLERQIQSLQGEKDKQQMDLEQKVSEIQREVTMEKERADSCLTQSLTEREEVEKRWQERWARHHTKLTDQLEILKTNYEGSLKCAKEREEALQREIHHLQDKLEKTHKAWDEYKSKVNEQLGLWKAKYDELEEELASTVKGKVDVEVMFQEKTQQLEELHEAVRQGCEERQDLQRRTEELERSIQEAAFGSLASAAPSLTYSPVQVPVQTEVKSVVTTIQATTTTNQDPAAALATWKQSQSFPPIKKIAAASSQQQQQFKISTSNNEQAQQSVTTTTTTVVAKQRPNSPFPIPGNTKSPQTFTVGMGKSTKGVYSFVKEKAIAKGKPSGISFSIAAPNASRKPPRL